MENLPAMHMMMSTEHRFPTEKNRHFEKEMLFVLNQEPSKKEKQNEEEGEQDPRDKEKERSRKEK